MLTWKVLSTFAVIWRGPHDLDDELGSGLIHRAVQNALPELLEILLPSPTKDLVIHHDGPPLPVNLLHLVQAELRGPSWPEARLMNEICWNQSIHNVKND